jgi:hypothetical protein
MRLENRHLTARISPTTGMLTHLSATGRGKGLIEESFCRYVDCDANRWIGGNHGDAAFDPIGAAQVTHSTRSVTSIVRTGHLTVTIQYLLPANSPLLKIHVQVKGRGPKGELGMLATPHIGFTPGFNDVFEELEDLFFDGAELGGGRELPCWRVFFRKGRRDGLLLATRTKRDMARFNILQNGFDLEPHLRLNYSSFTVASRPRLNPASRTIHETRFEIGPWTRSGHRRLLRAARLDKPVTAGHPGATGKPQPGLKGKIFCAAEFAPRSAAGKRYHPRKWMIADMPVARRGRALFATTGVKPPQVMLDPKLKGLYRVSIGIAHGAGVTLRISGDPETRYRSAEGVLDGQGAFDLALACRQRPAEADFGVYDMSGRTLRIGRSSNLVQPCVIDYVRFEKLSAAAARRWQRQERAEPILPLSGLSDIPDVACMLDARNPDIGAFRSIIWEHANCGIRKCYWRIDGQCSDYPSRFNTMRYPIARVHGCFFPQSKAYGRALLKTDMLELAVKAAKKYGVSLWGWMRFNSYMGNVQSDFYLNNPKYWDEWEHGRKGAKLCLAHKAVRDHKISILLEAVQYGLDGVCLGFLRHPPMVNYARVMRDAYRRKYGKQPPRDMAHPEMNHATTLPERGSREYLRWWKFRAGYLTQFGRELRKAFKDNGLEHIRIAIWVRPNHCLFDGIDMQAWLDEGLCDEVVTQRYCPEDFDWKLDWDRPAFRRMVQAKVPLIRSLSGTQGFHKDELKRVIDQGYDGFCTYESNEAVLQSSMIDVYRSLRRPTKRRMRDET